MRDAASAFGAPDALSELVHSMTLGLGTLFFVFCSPLKSIVVIGYLK